MKYRIPLTVLFLRWLANMLERVNECFSDNLNEHPEPEEDIQALLVTDPFPLGGDDEH